MMMTVTTASLGTKTVMIWLASLMESGEVRGCAYRVTYHVKITFCSCQGTDLGNEIGVGSAEECLNICFDTDGCSWVTYFQDDSFCVLLENCDGIEDCDDCIVASTNNEECDDDRPTGKVLLIMGGYNGTNMDNVEILDFEGGGCENIQLPPLPVATNWNLGMVQGDRELPMTCGGREYDNKVLTFLKKLFKLG